MTDRERLSLLESEYFQQPLAGQRQDLIEINHLRQLLGLPQVDASLKDPTQVMKKEAKKKEVVKKDHTEAIAVYRQYLKRVEELRPHQEYARQVEKATAGSGMTPVEPLATMGCGEGPLLCDVCGKPMILEGGKFHNVYADEAWARQEPVNRINWTSWIKGGMVVETQSNGTIRLYHGYERNEKDCCSIASRQHAKADAEHKSKLTPGLQQKILDFLADEFPDRNTNERYKIFHEIKEVLFDYDPGIGVNRPEGY